MLGTIAHAGNTADSKGNAMPLRRFLSEGKQKISKETNNGIPGRDKCVFLVSDSSTPNTVE